MLIRGEGRDDDDQLNQVDGIGTGPRLFNNINNKMNNISEIILRKAIM